MYETPVFLLASLSLTLNIAYQAKTIRSSSISLRWTIKASKDLEPIEINACLFSTIEKSSCIKMQMSVGSQKISRCEI